MTGDAWHKLLKKMRALGVFSAFAWLAACGGGAIDSATSTPRAAPPATLSAALSLPGVLHGGQQAITGSSLTLYAAGVPSNVAPTTLGSTTTDGNGHFNFQFTCP